MVSLATAPTATVMLSISSSDMGEATVSPASLVFTPENWNTNQAFTATGVDDDVDDGPQDYTITAASTSGDSGYSGLSATIAGTNADDDEAGIDLRSPIPGRGLGSSTSERESTEMYVVSLMSEPASAVTLLISSSDESEAVAAPPTLTFTQADWDTRQTFSVTGVDDDVEDGFQDYTITVLAASEDPDYEGQSERFSASNIDNDNAGIVLSETNVATDESGGAATVMVSLMSEPTSEVTLMFVSSDPDEAVASPPTLTFMPGNWNTNQPITVTGQDDGVDDGQQSYMITVEAASRDSNYNEETAEIARGQFGTRRGRGGQHCSVGDECCDERGRGRGDGHGLADVAADVRGDAVDLQLRRGGGRCRAGRPDVRAGELEHEPDDHGHRAGRRCG